MRDDYNSGMLHVQQGGSSRFARPLVMALSLLERGVGGFVAALFLTPHDPIWLTALPCAGLAMAYFDKRVMFRRRWADGDGRRAAGGALHPPNSPLTRRVHR